MNADSQSIGRALFLELLIGFDIYFLCKICGQDPIFGPVINYIFGARCQVSWFTSLGWLDVLNAINFCQSLQNLMSTSVVDVAQHFKVKVLIPLYFSGFILLQNTRLGGGGERRKKKSYEAYGCCTYIMCLG